MSHYSTFELDVAYADGLAAHPAIATHVQSCTRCSAYLANLDALAAPPMWNASELTAKAPARARPQRWRRNVAVAIGPVALAAGLVVVLLERRDPHPQDGYVGAKGTSSPSIQLLVQRQGPVRVIGDSDLVRPGDRIAFRVECGAFAFFTTLGKDHGTWTPLSQGACVGDLPFSLVVDDEPGAEEVVVVLGEERIDDATARSIAEGTPTPRTWSAKRILTKEIP